MPWGRVEGLWRCLFVESVVLQAPNFEVYKAVRDRLSDMVLLEVENWSYRPPLVEGQLRLVGTGSKWRLSPRLMAALEELLPAGVTLGTQLGGREMVHTLLQSGGMLFPQGRPVNLMETLSDLGRVSEACERICHEYAA